MTTTIAEKTSIEAKSEATSEFVDPWEHEEYLSIWLRRQAQSYANLDNDRGRLVAKVLTSLANDALACETPGTVLDVPTFLARNACLEAERSGRDWPDESDAECDGYRWVPTEPM